MGLPGSEESTRCRLFRSRHFPLLWGVSASQYDPGIRPGNAGGTAGSVGGKVRRRLGARTGTLTPPRSPRSSGKESQLLVGDTPILNPRAIGNVNQGRIAISYFFVSS
jgi:hypothetical protein